MKLDQYINQKQQLINSELIKIVENINAPNGLQEAIVYSINAGGKRLRPILMLSSFEAFSDEYKKVLHPALALEFIHTYSLVHDDLPAMDDDDLRRGIKTVHKQFSESTAILVGDGLLTYAFQLVSGSSHLEAEEKVYVLHQLSQASGYEGMIAGQYLDLEAENKDLTEEQLIEIHRNKTGKLIRSALKIGAYLGKATPPQIEALDSFGEYLGIVFQIQDDILDVTGQVDEIGKPVGSDESKNKSTYPKILGLDGAEKMKEKYLDLARIKYEEAQVNHPILLDLLNLFGNRSY